ncbi:MATE family efflux transporter [Vibrio diazotrophicus]|uniref:MATE family efflux transporter n=2 Tax=Vibrio diazotrophicus TaxID=685 RepID=UPI0009E015B6
MSVLLSPYVKRNLSLAWPLAFNALLMQSALMIDTYLVTPHGEISLAALGIATTIISFILGIQMALANGSQLVLSRSVGAGTKGVIDKGFWAALLINMSISGMFYLVLMQYSDVLIRTLTSESDILSETRSYLSVAKYIVVINAATQVMIALFNALGRTKVPFKGYLFELPINVITSYVLINGIGSFGGIGVTGAAVGSLIAIVIRLLFLTTCIYFESALTLRFTLIKSVIGSNVVSHFKEIFPVAANVTMLQIGATVYMLLYSQLAITSYIAMTIVMPWIKVGTQFITAWALTSAINISQAIGSRDISDLNKNVNVSIRMAVLISCFSALFFLLLSISLPSIYPDLDTSIYDSLSIIAPLYIVLPIVRGYNTVHGHVLRALGKTTEVFKVNFTGQWVISIPLCALVILYFELSIFWAFAVMPLEEIVKVYPFRYLARKTLNGFTLEQVDNLMYD